MKAMQPHNLSEMGRLLAQSLAHAPGRTIQITTPPKETTIHAPNVGNAVLLAYEQLRVASENIEDHLLFQSAVKRFYARTLNFTTHKLPDDTAGEMIIELTLAGYLKNNTVAESTAKHIDQMIAAEYESYWDMLKPDDRLKRSVARKWVLESLTVRTEQIFNNPGGLLSFASFAYQYFLNRIDVKDYIVDSEKINETDHAAILYIALHKSLLGSNDANVRSALRDMYAANLHDVNDVIAFNINYDRLSSMKTTARISRVVNKNGAPLRILRSACYDHLDEPGVVDLNDKNRTLELFSRKVDLEYANLRRKLNVGIIKSIVFLLITKAVIGLLIEIPYDLYVVGAIALVPLAVNLLFPPLFIALSGATLRIPSNENKQAIIDNLAGLLYEPAAEPAKLKPPRRVAKSRIFNVLYLLIFVTVFYFVARGLALLGFNLLQGVIFFIFLSTASFLGYRLSLQIKELELVPTSEGIVGLLRDTFYAPFVVVGRRISYRFARLNIIAQILDNVIELPLTTVLRLLRQWTAFLRNKQDEIS